MKKPFTDSYYKGGKSHNVAVIGSTLLLLMLLLAAMSTIAQTTVLPQRYWTFNGANAGTDSMGVSNLNFTAYGGSYATGTNGRVGKYITLSQTGNLCDGGALPLNNAVTVEFMMRPGYNFNLCNIMQRGDGAFAIKVDYPKIIFVTEHKSWAGATVYDELVITLDGIGKKEYGYYIDGDWHHFVFKFTSSSGVKEVWVDGELPDGFSKTLTNTGTFSTSGNTNFYLNSTVSYVRYFGDLDEIAVYNTAIPSTLIYKHYLGIQNGQPYSFTDDYTGTVPVAAPVTGPVDVNEFAIGHPSPTLTANQQIAKYPVPRYKPGHTLMKNVNWMDARYMGGLNQPGITQQMAANNGAAIVLEMAKNFNYYFNVEFGNNVFANALSSTANANPDLKLAVITLRAQLNGNHPMITDQSLPNSHYLQNSSGTFMDIYGNSTSTKIWRPTAPPTSYISDGNSILSEFNDLFTRLNGDISLVNENGEIFPHAEETALTKDPDVVAAKNASGLDWRNYLASEFAENESQSFRDIFMAHPKLANAKFTEYSIDGFPQYRFAYAEARKVNTKINNQYYATPDFYPRWPSNWRNWVSAWHGWQWIVDSRVNELAVGDKLYSPFVAAGWDANEELNIRPAQWLGLMKCLSMTGAEFFYAGFFSLSAPWPDSKNWIWQAIVPAYAQGITSRYEDFIRNGYLMDGDVSNYYNNPTAPGYTFWTGDLRKLVVIRKNNTQNKYAITGTIQPNSNISGATENESVANITLNGQTLKFNVRRQGSTYIYDNTNTAAPVFYQLDGWHEKTHPSRWSPDFNFEAELFDNNNSQVSIKTSVPAGTAAGDFTNFTSYISWADGSGTLDPVEYNFQPRSGSNNEVYLWVRARSKDGNTTAMNVQVDNNTAKTIGCITDTNWTWYRYDACDQLPINFQGLSLQNHTLKITPDNSKLEIDAIVLTADAGLILNPATATCSGATATITANGPTDFCQGGSVQLTASSGNTYLWSPGGQTTQSITANATNSYSVSVGNGTGCNAVSNIIQVNVSNAPSNTVSASGPTTFCQGGSVTLTAPAGYNYNWLPGGQTSQSISVTSSGNYQVQITNAQGCSATSSIQNVTVNTAPVVTVSANGPLTFCSGSNVKLTSSTGASYLWFPNGQTTENITVTNSGTYSVRVTAANGCSAMSSQQVVTVNSATQPVITASGATSFCTGSGVDLTSTIAESYLWSNGETTRTISVISTGTYSVTTTENTGCTAASAGVQTTENPLPTASISVNGPTQLQSGQTTILTATGGSSYLWSPGGETTSSITVSNAGTYSVAVTSASGCSNTSAPVVITQAAIPQPATISSSGSTDLCPGGSVTLTASSGAAYLWSPGGETTQSINVTGTGIYGVTVTDGFGNTATSPLQEVTVFLAPQAPGISMSYIPGTTYQLSAYEPTAHTYIWSTGATSQSINVNATGSYTVTAYNGIGCSSATKTIVVSNTAPQPCAQPNMLSHYNITDSIATLAWNPAITADSFVVSYTQIGTSNTQSIRVPGYLSSLEIGGLTPGATYQWLVKSYCGGAVLTGSTEQFTTLNGPMVCGSTPQEIEVTGVNSTFALLKWYATDNDKFVIRYRPQGTTEYLYRRSYNTLTEGVIQDLIPSTTYEVSVRSQCGTNASLYSEPIYLTTLPLCPNVGPAAVLQVTHNKVLLGWNAAIDVDQIRIRYAEHGTENYKTRKIDGTPNPGSKWLTGLHPNTKYDIWVSTICASGSTSMWGEPMVVTTYGVPTVRTTAESGQIHLNGYPNPTQYDIGYVFRIEDPSEYIVKVCDIMGKELISETRISAGGLETGKISLTGLANGFYTMIVQVGPMSGRFKFNISK